MYDGRLRRLAFPTGRVSRQRLAIARTALKMPGAFTVDDLTSAVRDAHPGIGTATVYRAVAAMAASGFVAEIGDSDGAALYTRCYGGAHHHHGVCERCGGVVRLECPIPDIEFRGNRDFEVTRHEFRVYGICGPCAEQPGAAS